MAPINYNRLDSERHEIRLLTIFPSDPLNHEESSNPIDSLARINANSFGTTLESSLISCTLKTVSLTSDAPSFVALSYTWGIQGLTKPILVDGRSVDIGINLEEALRHLRQPFRPVTLWADAICINQEDLAERSNGVRLMGRIYSHAPVLVWLGPAIDDSDLAMTALASLGKEAVQTGILELRGPDLLGWSKVDALAPLVAIRNAIDKLGDQFFAGFPHMAWKHLSRRACRSRLWGFQEVSLPPDILFVCGSKSLPFPHLVASTILLWIARLRKNATINVLDLVDPVRGPPLQAMRQAMLQSMPDQAPSVLLGCRRRRQRKTESQESLMEVLRRLCVNKPHPPNTGDLRDIVYGLLGMVSDLESLESLGFQVDYQKDIRQVYIETTKCLIKQGHLIILAWSQHSSPVPGWPSWVPDFSKPIREPCGEDNNVAFFAASGEYRFRTPENSHALHEDANTLLLTCVKVDAMREVGPPFIPAEDDRSILFTVREFMSSVESFCMLSKPSSLLLQSRHGEPPVRNFALSPQDYVQWQGARWRVPCADQFLNGNNRSIASNAFQQEYEKFRTYIAGHSQSAEEPRSQPCNEYLRSMEYQHHQRPFLSHEGWVGLAPARAQVDDVVCIVLGSNIPFVFRERRSGCYELIGEAYVDGIMDGEFMAGSPKLETFRVI